MIRAFEGKEPQVDEAAFVSEAAYLVGDVRMGPGSSVWPGVVVRAESGTIRLGANVHIQENSLLHHGPPGLDIGDGAVVGHNAVVHCRSIGPGTLIGNSATLLDQAEIGAGCVIAAGAVVRPGTKVPDGSFVAGVPAEVRPLPESMRNMPAGLQRAYDGLSARFRAAGLDARDVGRG